VLGQDGGVDPARQFAQLAQARLQLVLGLLEQRLELAVAGSARPRGAQQEREADQPRLRAVVQVALEPSPLGVARLHEPRSGRAQLLDPGLQLGVEVGDVAAQQATEERERHQARRDERRPPRGVARSPRATVTSRNVASAHV